MVCKTVYISSIGQLSLVAIDEALIGSWFLGQKYYEARLDEVEIQQTNSSVLRKTMFWLDSYFAGVSTLNPPLSYL